MKGKRAKRPRIPFWVLLRIGERDKWTCRICQTGYLPADPWRVDHDIALAAGEESGGTNHLKNLVLAHHSCNTEKGTL